MNKKKTFGLFNSAVSAMALSAGLLMAGPTLSADTEMDKEANKWDVMNPPMTGKRDVSLNVTEGTWMSVDVSPDGKTIAFDMLGDIYTIPINGGIATNISSGIQWDMQPRFSPDGKKIAFTSDRAGGDNLFIMNPDGSDVKQITKETFHLLNNPTWSPDGQYLVGRKHYTTRRSLGTGELWMYHINGGKGEQIIKRPNKQFQKELGEPIFAPDGKSIYFTRDTTPGNVFLYAQNVHKTIFEISEVDLTTGEVKEVISGPGGSVRAAPSPDGKSVAFVRRVDNDSALFIKDMNSNVETMIYADLDQDMQETWAVHGLYPNMDWTPDGKSIVFWAGGKIKRIDVASRRVTDIPFLVKDSRTVFDPPQMRVDVAPDSIDVKMARWAHTSDDGTIIFEALGHIYTQKSGGTAKRLTSDKDDHFEIYPTISPDGKYVYFASWDDQELGSIHRVSIRGGKSKVISKDKGQFIELAISPDGETLAYRKSNTGYLFTPKHSVDSGIYAMPTKGGEATLISQSGSASHFGGENDRIYVHGGGHTLTSYNLEGFDKREHATSDYAREMKASPDGKWLAFVENYKVYITPRANTGKAIDIGPKMSGLPVAKITDMGGYFLNWSHDGAKLNFSLGQSVYSVDMATFANALDDSDKMKAKDFLSTATVSLKAAADKPHGWVALIGARLITMNDDMAVIDNGTILINGNRIVNVGPSTEVKVPKGAKVVNMAGKTIMPGMVDAHAHGAYGRYDVIPEQSWPQYATLGLGVTTVHDPSSRAATVFAASEYQRAGHTLAPRIFSTAEIVYGAKSESFADINSFDDAMDHLKRLKAEGATSIKNYNQPRRDQRQQVAEAARQLGMYSVTEGGSLYHTDMNMVVDGNRGIEHTLPNETFYEDVLQFWPQTKVGYTPTLVVGYGGMNGEDYWYQHTEVWKHPLLTQWVPPHVLEPRSVRRIAAPDKDYAHWQNAAKGKALADRGVSVHTGAHGQREGLGTHWEMWMFVQGGMTPMEAIKAATIQPARYLSYDKDLGSLENGKLADLVVLDANPLENIRNSDKIAKIMLNGRLYDAKTLNEEVTGKHTNQPFYWQK